MFYIELKKGIEAVEYVIGQSIKIDHVKARVGGQLSTKANIDKAENY